MKPGDCVITTDIEHNSVMRPLEALRAQGITIAVLETNGGSVYLDQLNDLLKQTGAQIVICHHGSNLIGSLTPLHHIGQAVHEHGALFIVDAAQTFGAIPIDVRADKIDVVVVSGHKALGGVGGSGGFVLRSPDLPLRTFIEGGTGSHSEHILQPEELPFKFEAGTPNMVGIVGMLAGLKEIRASGIDQIAERHHKLRTAFYASLNAIDRVHVLPAPDIGMATISFTVEGLLPGEVAYLLDHEYNICSRSGLHCAPMAHSRFGTLPHGAVRFSADARHSLSDIEEATSALVNLVKRFAN